MLSQPEKSQAQSLALAEYLAAWNALIRSGERPGDNGWIGGLPADLRGVLASELALPRDDPVVARTAAILSDQFTAAWFSAVADQALSPAKRTTPRFRPIWLPVSRPTMRREMLGGRLGPAVSVHERLWVPGFMELTTGRTYAGTVARWRAPFAFAIRAAGHIAGGALLAVAMDEASDQAAEHRAQGYSAGAAIRQVAPLVTFAATAIPAIQGMPVLIAVARTAGIGVGAGLAIEIRVHEADVLEAVSRRLLVETGTSSLLEFSGAGAAALASVTDAAIRIGPIHWRTEQNIARHVEVLRGRGVSDVAIAATLDRFGIPEPERRSYLEESPIRLVQQIWDAQRSRARIDAQTEIHIRTHIDLLRGRGLSDDAIAPTLDRFGVPAVDRSRYLTRPGSCRGCAYAAEIDFAEPTTRVPAPTNPLTGAGPSVRGGVSADIRIDGNAFRRDTLSRRSARGGGS